MGEPSRHVLAGIVADRLQSVAWGAETRRFRVLSFAFSVRTSDPALTQCLEDLYAPFASPGLRVASPSDRVHTYSFLDRGPEHRRRFLLYFDEKRLVAFHNPTLPFSMLIWHITNQAIERERRYLLVHAGVVAHGDAAVVLPGRPNAGKTTLVAGLVRAGFEFLSDEIAIHEPPSTAVYPFPRAMAIERGSWPLLADLEPANAAALAEYAGGGEWLVPPTTIRPDAIANARDEVAYVIFPSYEPGAPTVLEPVGRAEAVFELAQGSFNLARWGRQGLETLGNVARGAECFRLTTGDLDRACGLVCDLVGVDRGRELKSGTR